MFKKASSEAAASDEAEAYSLGYVETLSDARTKLEAFFNILLGRRALNQEQADFGAEDADAGKQKRSRSPGRNLDDSRAEAVLPYHRGDRRQSNRAKRKRRNLYDAPSFSDRSEGGQVRSALFIAGDSADSETHRQQVGQCPEDGLQNKADERQMGICNEMQSSERDGGRVPEKVDRHQNAGRNDED